MHRNAWGRIAAGEWERVAVPRENVTIDAFVMMPDYTHAIIRALKSPA